MIRVDIAEGLAHVAETLMDGGRNKLQQLDQSLLHSRLVDEALR